jgi:hypothetical protein
MSFKNKHDAIIGLINDTAIRIWLTSAPENRISDLAHEISQIRNRKDAVQNCNEAEIRY